MTGSKAQTIATLVAARAAIDALLLELTDEVVPAPADGPSEEPATCQHEHRTDMKSFGAVEHWVCDDCGYEYRR